MSETLRIEKPIYGGFGLAHLAEGSAVFVPFALAGEVAEVEITAGKQEAELLRVLEASPARTEPACPHFGACGGCHLQMASYDEQLRIKREVLQETLQHAGVTATPAITAHASPSPWHYRNRIRLHVVELDGTLRLGYRRRASQQILPIDTCPIAAPLLWNAAEILVQMAATDPTDRAILSAAREIEFFCDAEEQRLQITLMITASSIKEKLAPLAEKARSHLPQLSGMAVARMDPRSGQLRNELQSWALLALYILSNAKAFGSRAAASSRSTAS